MPSVHYLERRDLERYLADDRIARLLEELEAAGDDAFTSHRWLKQSAPKRLIFDAIYGDLLFAADDRRRRVLDVGGGFTALSRQLVRRHDYHLIDIFAHDKAKLLEPLQTGRRERFWSEGDWYDVWPPGPQDLIIANDLFPNTDQRLEAFLQRALACGSEVRVSLTYYNELRYYITRRIDADEILCVKAYDGEQTAAVLSKFAAQIPTAALHGLTHSDRASLYPNGRHVAIARLRGGV